MQPLDPQHLLDARDEPASTAAPAATRPARTLQQRVRSQRAGAAGADRDRLFLLQAQRAMASMKVSVLVVAGKHITVVMYIHIVEPSTQGGTTARHAHFGATYVQQHIADDRVKVLRAPAPEQTLPLPNRTARPPAPTLPAQLLVGMCGVVEELLQGSYAILMTQLRRELQPGLHVSRLEADDFVRFLQLARFFHQYVRLKTVRCP